MNRGIRAAPWLNAMPGDWEVAKVAHLFASGMGQTITKEMLSEGARYPVFSASESVKAFGQIDAPKVVLVPGDLVIGARGSIGMVRLIDCPATCTQTTIWLKARTDRVTSKFAFYALSGLRELVFPFEKTAIPQLTVEQVKAAWIGLPPLETQTKIVTFLDSETAKTDELIAKYARLVDLLEEKRVVLITRAVTKGLDINAPMKNSGIEWIGEIPMHWKLTPLRHIASEITVGIVVTPAAYYENSGVPCLRSLNVTRDGILDSDLVFISPESNELLAKSQIRQGDVVVVRTGETGRSAVIPERYEGANCIDLVIIRRGPDFSSEFLCQFLKSRAASVQIALDSVGAIQQHFNIAVAKSLMVPLPPLREQQEIVAALSRENSRIAEITLKAELAIKGLLERRSALITAAVTGQIDVKNYKGNNMEVHA